MGGEQLNTVCGLLGDGSYSVCARVKKALCYVRLLKKQPPRSDLPFSGPVRCEPTHQR